MEAGSEAADMQIDFQEALRELCFWEGGQIWCIRESCLFHNQNTKMITGKDQTETWRTK